MPHWTVWLTLSAGILTALGVFASGAVLVHRYLRGRGYRGPERRTSTRRADNPVDVLITDADGQIEPYPAVVHDRSMDGLGLLLDREVAVGTILRVLPSGASPDTDWVRAEVRHCGSYRVKDQTRVGPARMWRVGCKFAQPPRWAVLRRFG